MEEKQKTFLEQLLDFLIILSVVVFFTTLLLKVWMGDENQWILNRIWISSLIVFIASVFIFGLCCYKGSDK